MSFWISLEDDLGNFLTVDTHAEGGTYALGGTDEADLNVTYNYSPFWPQAFGPKPDGPHSGLYGLGPWLHDKTGAETLLLIESGLAELSSLDGVGPDEDYWAATPGNAARVLATLAAWAREHPDGRWNVHSG